MEITPQIWICIGFMVYYLVFQIVDDVMRISRKTNSNCRIIEKLRSEYKVTIRSFYARRPLAFASFRAIWLNEKLFKSEKLLIYAFHHEYYHFKNHQKAWSLVMRFIISLLPLTNYFVNWAITICILLAAAYLMNIFTDGKKGRFEKKADEYAKKMTSNGKNKETA